MYYLANCVMSVCCCVKSLEKSTLSIGKRLLAIEKKNCNTAGEKDWESLFDCHSGDWILLDEKSCFMSH